MQQSPEASQQTENVFELVASRQFLEWLIEQNASIVFSTYQAGKLFLIGAQKSEGKLSVFERTFPRCMGLWADKQTIYMSSLYELWRFENALLPGQIYQEYDAVYVPQMCYVTGDLDIHDVAIDKNGDVIFINSLFSCLAKNSYTHSFKPIWKPPFISKLAAEDRCHLNGLAMENGEPRYVTCVAEADVHEGWREHREKGGIVIDITTNEIVCRGLSMPHSPRLHNGKLWLLESGTGYFGYVDLKKSEFVRVTFCPGYIRGLSFIGDFAIVGLSKCRQNGTFSGLELDKNLAEKKIEARSGLHVIDLRTGDIVHSLRIEGIIVELY
ncbi:MAG: TIGR03032 family protein, partial [Pseudomonadota bacterium]|nr:TIGR03032 family protein [Pseudomonadota bacterium]